MCLHHLLFETALGDVLCRAVERVTGCMLVPLSGLDYHVAATERGKAAIAKRHNADAAYKIRRRGRRVDK